MDRVDVEPTGDAFNSIYRLEMHKPGKPFNPMINAGAITVSSILPGKTSTEKLAYIFDLIENLIGSVLLLMKRFINQNGQLHTATGHLLII